VRGIRGHSSESPDGNVKEPRLEARPLSILPFRSVPSMQALADLTGRLGSHQLTALLIGVLACFFDLRTKHIPNPLTLGGAAVALVYWFVVGGPAGLGMSIVGWLVGVAVFLPFFLLGGLGAGDVKLLGCLGAWLGLSQIAWTGLYAAIAGGIMGIAVALGTGYLRTAVDNVYVLLVHFRVRGVRPHPDLTLDKGKGPRLPYALPILAGSVVAIWLQ
jgi:prepilin peptidase CpaA